MKINDIFCYKLEKANNNALFITVFITTFFESNIILLKFLKIQITEMIC